MFVLSSRQGRIVKIISKADGVSELLVEIDNRLEKAINYDVLTGEPLLGDEVCLNVTAVKLGLGSGGYHFVMGNYRKFTLDDRTRGHVMKLRYTPMQLKVLAVEERSSPYREKIEQCSSLEGTPVIVGTLHSMLVPVIAGLRAAGKKGLRIAYIMTDGGALPLFFSKTVSSLRNKRLLAGTVTVGHAFGGDLEAVNVYSGLLAAKAVLEADAIVVTMGPGIVGTGTTWGFSGVEQGEILNAVHILGGRSIAVPRLSFADPRERHRGLSHHTITVLQKIAVLPAIVPLPVMSQEKMKYLKNVIKKNRLALRHRFIFEDGEGAIKEIEKLGLKPTTMGRGINEDREFFLAGGAAGVFAARMLSGL